MTPAGTGGRDPGHGTSQGLQSPPGWAGAAWGAPIDRVEVRIDDGDWQAAELDLSETAEHAWTIWSVDWPNPTAGTHTITSRAVDAAGNIQPAMDDPMIVNKHTYWESNGQVTRESVIS